MRFCKIAALLFVSCTALAQMAQLRFEHLSVEEGLSQSSVWCIMQDSRGFVWIGTSDGLNRYDGYSFEVFRHDARKLHSLSDNTIHSLAEDSSGRVWIGTRSGLHYYDRSRSGVFRLSDEFPAEGEFLNVDIQKMLVDGSGSLWIGSAKGLKVFDPVQKRFLSPPLTSFPALPLMVNKGKIWVGCRDSLYLIDVSTRAVENVPLPVRTGIVLSCVKDFHENVWIGTELQGVFSRIPGGEWIRREVPQSTVQGANAIRAVGVDFSGNIWIGGVYGGLRVLDPEKNSLIRVTPSFEGPSSARYEGLACLFRDRSGVMWAGYDGSGIVKVTRKKFPRLILPDYDRNGTGDNFFKAILEDFHGNVWLGTYDAGVTVLNRNSSWFKRFFHNAGAGSLRDNTVQALLQTDSRVHGHEGSVWIGCRTGLDEFDGKALRHYFLPPPFRENLRTNIITTLCEDSNGVVWIGATSQLFRLDSGRIRSSGLIDAPLPPRPESLILCLLPQSDGKLLVGTSGSGLCLFDPRHGDRTWFRHEPGQAQSLSHNSVKTLCQDSGGVVWVGTEDGLCRFDRGNNSWHVYKEQDGLPNNFIYGILMDSHRNLWVSTNRGLARVDARDPDLPKIHNYAPDDGLQSYEFNTGAFCKTRSGELLFGGVNGLNVFHPDSIADNPLVPPVVITKFKKFDQPVSLGADPDFLSEFTLGHDETVFSFEFAALDFTNPRSNHYAYVMEGVDRDWIYCGTRREARYTHLDPGSYVFRVKGSNNDGLWNEAGISVKIEIVPPWYRTWWAYCLYALFVASSGLSARWIVSNWKIIVANRKARYVSHFKLLEQVGHGGMGRVFKAVDNESREIVALKLLDVELLKDPENKKRLAAEGRMLSSFSHPNIVRILESGESTGQCFLAMEFLPGGTLKDLLSRSFPLPLQSVKSFCLQICSGLEEIHRNGIIHRDIKTGNVMLDASGNIRIMDFGLSKSPLVTTMTTLGTVIGTLGYVAPEQVTNLNVDERVDIFSFGVVLYELLTNRLPFKGENEIAVIHSIFNTIPPPPSDFCSAPRELDAVVSRCLAKNPDERFASIRDLIVALEGDFW